jgi:probable phosphoglycerate mutase
MKLHLIRHGESVYNAEGRIQGHADIPLSELGCRQAEATAEALAGQPIDAIYASPLRRAAQTAAIIAKRLGLPIQFNEQLKEINVGIFQGKIHAELEREYPVEIARWRSEEMDYAVPGGESRRQLLARGWAAFEAIIAESRENVVVVSHGRILMTTIKALLGMPLTEPPFSLQNGSITTLSYREGQFELIALDRIDHLRSIGLSGSGDL